MNDSIDSLDSSNPAEDAVLPLSPGTVAVWRVKLDIGDWDDCTHTLSIAERQAAERFAFPRDRRRFTVARAMLRRLLGSYSGTPVSHIRLGVGPYGKPRLVTAGGARSSFAGAFFNVTHSDELALIAVSPEREVGIDVERIRPLVGLDDIVARHFAPDERVEMRHAGPADRLALFYRYWTLKEAYLKAVGVGLRMPLADVDVSTVSEHPTRLPAIPQSGKSTGSIAQRLEAGAGYAAALVVEGTAPYAVMVRDLAPPGASRRPLTVTQPPHTVGASGSAGR